MLVYVLCLIILAHAHGLQVNTTEGVVEGSRAGDGDYYAFYGIPYAGSTTGSNRFKTPPPPPKHPGVLNAINSNVICAQPSTRGLIGIENCLTLNIFTKNVSTPKPVIVVLNSEEYTTSYTQSFSVKRFIEENVVMVYMNFRLSIFGFLCLGVKEAPGNAGLKDIVQGLKWINANIGNFGGNPNNVVLLGHGSGGAIVDILTLSARSKGLVHKAVALSGSALAPWAVAYDPVGYARSLGVKVGYTQKKISDFARHLTLTDISVLATAINEFHFTNNTPLFAPCIENPTLNSNDSILTDVPITLLRSGNYSQIPYITGFVTEEGTLKAAEASFGGWIESMQTNFSNFLQVDLDLSNNRTKETQSIREFYFGKSQINMGTIDDYLDYIGDTMVVVSVIRTAKERALTSKSEVRLLEFGYMGTQNTDWIFTQIPLNGVRHGGILNYLFDYDLKPADESVMSSIVKRFTQFAHTGVPTLTTGASNSTSTTPWPAITKDTFNYLYYGGQSSAIPIKTEEARFDPHVQRMDFWNNLYSKYYIAPKTVNSAVTAIHCLLLILLSQLFVRFL